MSPISIPLNTQETTNKSLRKLFARYDTDFYRTDIQGIRAISALLIMVYHIWLGKVSGGVDVFFVISGFLVTTTMLKGLARKGKIEPIKFFSRIFRRVLPSAFTVLLVTISLSLVFIPAPLWKHSITEFIASAAQIENLELIRIGTDYLAREAPPSQFQQFWALSIQMQFYVVLIAICAALAQLTKATKTLRPFILGLVTIVALSFLYSIWVTQIDPTGAYFNPLARIWEFLVGSLIAAYYPFISQISSITNKRFWSVLSLAALLTLTIFGLFTGSASFPGWIAAIPVMCTAVLLIGGKTFSEKNTVVNFLSNSKLAYLGSFSFLIYLWHWPVLVFTHYQLGHTNLSFLEGLIVIILAIFLAAVTKKFIEDPLNQRPILRPGKQFIVYVSIILAFCVVGAGLRQGTVYLAHSTEPVNSSLMGKPLSIQESVDIPFEKFVSIDLDRPDGIKCLTDDCTGGDVTAARTLVMVGASHSAQWFDIVDQFGKENGYKVLTRFNDDDIVQIAIKTDADAIFMNSTRTSPDNVNQRERLFLDRPGIWDELIRDGIDLVAIRDNPRFGFFQNACVWENQEDASACAIGEKRIFLESNPADAYSRKFENFHSIDLTEKFCADSLCPAVHDNVLIYYDKHHISKTYSDYIAQDLISILEEKLPRSTG